MKFKCITILIFSQVIFAAAIAQVNKVNLADKRQDSMVDYKKPQQSITYNTVTIDCKAIRYKAVAGTIVLKNTKDTPTVSMFYTAYFKEGEKDAAQRPITYLFNGGPGSATVWLHIGAFGPQRVFLNETGYTTAPYKTVNNDYSILDASDLVFIDAPATGFSRIITKEMGGAGKPKDFFNAHGDANAFADFIEQFLSEFNRWNSPQYLFGESYGTYRSAIVSDILLDKGINLNGVMLLSQVLNIENLIDNPFADQGNELKFQLAVPSFAAVAWYHKALPYQPEKLEPFLKEVEQFAMNDYALALNKGSVLDTITFNRIAGKLHAYTGLSEEYIKRANLRIGGQQFAHEILNKIGKITGRLDARYLGDAIHPLGENISYDALDAFIVAPYMGTFNNYVRNELKYGMGQTYYMAGIGVFGQWDFKYKIPDATNALANIYPNVMPALTHAMIFNPTMKVMVNSGYFDLGTPYYEGIYEMQHLHIPHSLQKNIEFNFYHCGHMVYLEHQSLVALHDNVVKFINKTH